MPGVEPASHFQVPAAVAPDTLCLNVGDAALRGHVDLVPGHHIVLLGIVLERLVEAVTVIAHAPDVDGLTVLGLEFLALLEGLVGDFPHLVVGKAGRIRARGFPMPHVGHEEAAVDLVGREVTRHL